MLDRFEFDHVARMPAAGDNVAIATRRLDAGTMVTGTGRKNSGFPTPSSKGTVSSFPRFPRERTSPRGDSRSESRPVTSVPESTSATRKS